MEKTIYTIFDSATKAYNVPFFQLTTEEAIRSFKKLVNEPGSLIFESPGDFTLMSIGTFDPQTGLIADWPPHKVSNGLEVKEEVNLNLLDKVQGE